MPEKDIEDELVEDLLSPFQSALNPNGIDNKFLIRQLKKEFKAKKRFTLKVKGAVNPDTLAKGWKVVATTGIIAYEAGSPYATGETILEYQDDLIDVQQKARIDVHKLRGDYPAEKHQIEPGDGFSSLLKDVLKEIDGLGRGKLPSQEED